MDRKGYTLAKMEKHFAVIGLGRFGTSVAMTLQSLGHEVLAIDSDAERVQKLSDQVTHVVQVDTTEESALMALGLRNFDAIVVAIGEDVQANVATTLLLKEIGVPYIIAKARNALHGKMLEKIGADRVVYPERDMGQRVAHSMVSANVLDYIELSPNLSDHTTVIHSYEKVNRERLEDTKLANLLNELSTRITLG